MLPKKFREIKRQFIFKATHELIESSCDKLRPVIYENANNDYVDETITTGTTLFELYLALQQFCKLGLEIFNGKLLIKKTQYASVSKHFKYSKIGKKCNKEILNKWQFSELHFFEL